MRARGGAHTFWDGDLLGDSPGVIQGTVDALTFVTDSLRAHVRDAVVASVLDRYRGVALRLAPGADPRRLGLRGAEARAAERLRDHALVLEEFTARGELAADDARRLAYLLLITRTAGPDGVDVPAESGVRAAVASDSGPRIGSASIPPKSAGPGRHSVASAATRNLAAAARIAAAGRVAAASRIAAAARRSGRPRASPSR